MKVLLLIIEFSDAISVRAIRSYTDNHVGVLNFAEGDCITVRERNFYNEIQKQNIEL
jgi:hypothetical protein